MNHIKPSRLESKNGDSSMESEEDKGIGRLDARVDENGTSLVNIQVSPEYACNGKGTSVYIGKKRKSSFSSPIPAKISLDNWNGKQKEERPSVIERMLCNSREVASGISVAPPIPQMMIVGPHDISYQATSDNISEMLVSEDTDSHKNDISTDSIPGNGYVSNSNRECLSFPDRAEVIRLVDGERLLFDTEGLSPETEGSSSDIEGTLGETENPSSKARGSPPDTKRSSPDTEGSPSESEGPSADTRGSSTETEGSSPDTEDSPSIIEGASSDIGESSTEIEGPSSDIGESSPEIQEPSSDIGESSPETEVSSLNREGPLPNTEGTSTDTENSSSKTKRSPTDKKGPLSDADDSEESSLDTKRTSPYREGYSPDSERTSTDTKDTTSGTEGASSDIEDPKYPNIEVKSPRVIPPAFYLLSNRSLEILREHLITHDIRKIDAIYDCFEFLDDENEFNCQVCETRGSELSPRVSPLRSPSSSD